jgi:DNA-binding transcriptional MerR regulator
MGVGTKTKMEDRYSNGQAAKRIGVTKNTLYLWEKKRLNGEQRYADFPVPHRVAHSNHRYYTDEDIKRIIEWKNRTTNPLAA